MCAQILYQFCGSDEPDYERGSGVWPNFPISFFTMCVFVGLVSVYDAWLAVKYWDSILNLECNPICTYLIHLGNGDSSFFFRAKMMGTVGVLSVLAVLYRSHRRLALPVAGVISCFQLMLLIYLNVR